MINQEVRFDLFGPVAGVAFFDLGNVWEETAEFERKLVRRVQIKRHNASPDERPVVTMPLTMGPIQRTVEVTLNNRDSFEYPVLVGRNFLDGHAVVDVGQQYIAMDEQSE